MSPAKKTAVEEEADRIEGEAHPRETYDLTGQGAALARAARAIRSGRSPQAWLVAGPPGVGKATLAYRIARYVLKYGTTADGPADLAVAANDPVSHQIEAQAHPGLLVLKRRADPKTGRMRTVLNVDEVRRVREFFGLTSGAGGWRVAIADSADEMNDNAANALLKILEEPPPRALLILIAHAPGRLLPTIRSRCQRLDLKPLSDALLGTEMAKLLPEISDDDRAALVRVAEGSLGLALRLASGDGLALARDAQTLIETRGAPDIAAILTLGERVARATDGLAHFGQFLAQALARRIRARAADGEGGLDEAVASWERVNALFGRAGGLHMEPRQTVLSAAITVQSARANR